MRPELSASRGYRLNKKGVSAVGTAEDKLRFWGKDT